MGMDFTTEKIGTRKKSFLSMKLLMILVMELGFPVLKRFLMIRSCTLEMTLGMSMLIGFPMSCLGR